MNVLPLFDRVIPFKAAFIKRKLHFSEILISTTLCKRMWKLACILYAVQANQCPYFSYFSLLFDPEPYFLEKQPY